MQRTPGVYELTYLQFLFLDDLFMYNKILDSVPDFIGGFAHRPIYLWPISSLFRDGQRKRGDQRPG